MSSNVATGAQQKSKIKQRKKPDYYSDVAGLVTEKESLVDLVEMDTAAAGDVHIGLKIRDNQSINEFNVYGTLNPGDPNPAYTKMTVTALTGATLTEVRRQLNVVCPVTYLDNLGRPKPTGEKWVAYKAIYDPGLHGLSFRTELTLKPFNFCPANGFQVVTTAFTYVGMKFDEDHYLVGTSVLPGSDSDFDHSTVRMSAGKSAAKGKKRTKTRKKGKRK